MRKKKVRLRGHWQGSGAWHPGFTTLPDPQVGHWGNWKLGCQQFAQRGPLSAGRTRCEWPPSCFDWQVLKRGPQEPPGLCCFGGEVAQAASSMGHSGLASPAAATEGSPPPLLP